jgi:hypothetical protein
VLLQKGEMPTCAGSDHTCKLVSLTDKLGKSSIVNLSAVNVDDVLQLARA